MINIIIVYTCIKTHSNINFTILKPHSDFGLIFKIFAWVPDTFFDAILLEIVDFADTNTLILLTVHKN